jgi:hypothetical protein
LPEAEIPSTFNPERQFGPFANPTENEGCMDIPLRIAFHGVDHSDAVEESIRAAVDKLGKLNSGITGCRVAVEGRNHEAETHRASICIRVDVTVRGAELVVTEEPKNGSGHDLPGAVRRAFATMERQIKDRRERKHR